MVITSVILVELASDVAIIPWQFEPYMNLHSFGTDVDVDDVDVRCMLDDCEVTLVIMFPL